MIRWSTLRVALGRRGINLEQATPIRRGVGGWKFDVVSGGSHFLLRILKGSGLPTLEYAFALQDHVADVLGAAPSVIPLRGRGYVLPLGEYRVILETMINAAPAPISPARAGMIGQGLGRIHRAIVHPPRPETRHAWQKLRAMAIRHAHTLRPAGRDAIWSEHCQRHAQAVARASRVFERSPLRCGIHGDANPTNVLWCGRRMWFCDFANASPLPQVIDFVMAAIGIGILHWNWETARELPLSRIAFQKTITQRYISAYLREAPLSPVEDRLIGDLFVILLGYWMRWIPIKSCTEAHRLSKGYIQFTQFACGRDLSGLLELCADRR